MPRVQTMESMSILPDHGHPSQEHLLHQQHLHEPNHHPYDVPNEIPMMHSQENGEFQSQMQSVSHYGHSAGSSSQQNLEHLQEPNNNNGGESLHLNSNPDQQEQTQLQHHHAHAQQHHHQPSYSMMAASQQYPPAGYIPNSHNFAHNFLHSSPLLNPDVHSTDVRYQYGMLPNHLNPYESMMQQHHHHHPHHPAGAHVGSQGASSHTPNYGSPLQQSSSETAIQNSPGAPPAHHSSPNGRSSSLALLKTEKRESDVKSEVSE